jgi:hypothetical protein
MLSPDCHSRTCGAGGWAHARPCGHAQLRLPQLLPAAQGGGRTHDTAATLSPDRHSRTCGVGERAHARLCGHAQLRPPQSHLRRRGAVARTALRPCSAQTATVAPAAWGGGRTHGPVAVVRGCATGRLGVARWICARSAGAPPRAVGGGFGGPRGGGAGGPGVFAPAGVAKTRGPPALHGLELRGATSAHEAPLQCAWRAQQAEPPSVSCCHFSCNSARATIILLRLAGAHTTVAGGSIPL